MINFVIDESHSTTVKIQVDSTVIECNEGIGSMNLRRVIKNKQRKKSANSA